MAAADKARFYFEQQAPELRALERKNLFSKDEIAAIAKKRGEFEHNVNSRGASASDYTKYIEFEINFENLRRKRVKRLGVKNGGHSGQRRIFFLLDRATKKCHGDLGLWMQYLDYARKERANKKLSYVMTSVLRLHPTRPELWIYSAQHAAESQGDMLAARSYMQRGLRFCKPSRNFWVEYGKLEMIYIARIAARQCILGLDDSMSGKERPETEEHSTDMIAIPNAIMEDTDTTLPTNDVWDEFALPSLASTPALGGAIPIAIFDTAMRLFDNDPELGAQFFDMLASFENVPCLKKIIKHVVDTLVNSSPSAVATSVCVFRQPLVSVDPCAAEFPAALANSIERLKDALSNTLQRRAFSKRVIGYLLPFAGVERLDAGVRRVISVYIKKLVSIIGEDASGGQLGGGGSIAGVISDLRNSGRLADAQTLLAFSLKKWNDNRVLIHLRETLGT